ncbi:hypothetical protein KSC_059630 [Ktedonobacter sp. SOSP1-52]|nr:hypothetical protein KSC_059630 [Ktedonobacter sp. SOSP1-52]
MEQAEEQERRGPLTNKEAPITFFGRKQKRRSYNRDERCPVPDLFRDLVCDAKVLIMGVFRNALNGVFLV